MTLKVTFSIPQGLKGKLGRLSTDCMLGLAGKRGLSIVEAAEAIPKKTGNARYIGVRLEPKG